MMWGYYGGAGWIWMTVMMIVFWGGVFALALFAVRAFSSGRRSDDALEVLRRRFAAGEIGQEEYDQRRRTLLG